MKTTDYAGLAPRLHTAMKGETIAHVAEQSGVSARSISRILAGERPRNRTLNRLIDGLEISGIWLYYGTGQIHDGYELPSLAAPPPPPPPAAAVAAAPPPSPVTAIAPSDIFEAIGAGMLQLAESLRERKSVGLRDDTIGAIKSYLFPPLPQRHAEQSPETQRDSVQPPLSPPGSQE